MALVSMRQLLDHAAENSYGLPAFHIPSILRIGEITTPIATIIASITIRSVCILCFSIVFFLPEISGRALSDPGKSFPSAAVCP